jgi:membrane protease YdiL (CAAX protease family)
VVFRRGGERVRAVLRHQARGFVALLPATAQEKRVFAGLAITAGICEELLFRGFGIAYVRWLWPGASDAALIALTAASFGLVHLYQGARGVVLTTLVGAYLASVTVSAGSLLPAMVMHALLDLRVLALPDLRSSV